MGEAKRLSVNTAEMQSIRLYLERKFPNLAIYAYEPESERTDEYNCIAWAANDTERWWWPVDSPDAYWPIEPRIVEKESFIAVFKMLGYEEYGSNFALESDLEKVALYLNANGKPEHMARQIESGIWTSKLGQGWDIVHHTLEGLEGAVYGQAAIALRRPIKR
jgi:hypothetical protein